MLHGLRYCDWCGPTARQGEWQNFRGMRTPEGVVWKPDPKGEVRVCPGCIERGVVINPDQAPSPSIAR